MAMTFVGHVAAVTLGLLPGDELPDVATAALVDGYESPSLAALAGQSTSRYDAVECRRLLEKALDELGLRVPTVIDAGQTMVRVYARLVAAGEVEPSDGASRFMRVFQAVTEVAPGHGTDAIGAGRLIDLYFEYDRCGSWGVKSIDEQIDTDVLRECKRIVGEASRHSELRSGR
jgi:hypothetical protein